MSLGEPGVKDWLNWVDLAEKTAELLREGWVEEDIDLMGLIEDIAESPGEAERLRALLAKHGKESIFGAARRINEFRDLLRKKGLTG